MSKSSSCGLRVARTPLPPLPGLEKLWRELESRSEDHSLFTSWDWIGLWLARLPARVERSLLKVELDGRVVALAVLCAHTVKRNGLSSRALFFNSTGDPDLDELTIEYNDLLVERGLRPRALKAAMAYLERDPGWDELFFDGWESGEALGMAVQGLGGRFIYRRSKPTHRVDLDALRGLGKSHLDSLSGRVRYGARRAFKMAGSLGPVTFEVAATPAQREEFFAGLRELHQSAWRKKQLPGSFANEFFCRFHEDLVQQEGAGGLVQLGRLSVGERPVGYVYNLIHRRRVYNYQSGFDFERANGTDWRPGIMCHIEAIAFSMNAGMAVYDFMAGDYAYKKQLGNPSPDLAWLVFQRPRLKFKVEDRLKAWWHVLRRRKALRVERTSGTEVEAEVAQN